MKTFTVKFDNQPWKNVSFEVRGICEFNILNPCWDNRKDDIYGRHWGGGDACTACAKAAKAVMGCK